MLWIVVRLVSKHMFLGVNKGKKLFIIYHTGTCWDSL